MRKLTELVWKAGMRIEIKLFRHWTTLSSLANPMNSSMCKADNTWHEFKTCCPSPPPFSPPTSSGPFTRLSACGREESSAMKCRESLWDLMRSGVQMLPHSHTFQFLQLIYFPMSILNAKSQNNREIMTRKNRKERLLNFKITMFWTPHN